MYYINLSIHYRLLNKGRLGHGDNGWKYVPRITQSLAGQVVSMVTCGSYHTAAVTGNGDLYTWYGVVLE